jgi:hypothetical protein
MRLKGSFGNMTMPTIIDDLFRNDDNLKCFVIGSDGVEYDVNLILHCKNEMTGRLK